MSVIYTWDVYSTLDGFASYTSDGDWGGYWGKEGPEFLKHRSETLNQDQTLILGGNTFRQFTELLTGPVGELDPVNARMKSMPTTVLSKTLRGPIDWPDATLVEEDAINYIKAAKETGKLPMRSHGSLSMNRGLMAAGLVDLLQVSIFPVVSGQTGQEPVFDNAQDFDLELVESQTFDGRIQVLKYKPTLHGD